MTFSTESQHEYLIFPNDLTGFHQEEVKEVPVAKLRPRNSTGKSKWAMNSPQLAYIMKGTLDQLDHPVCTNCICPMHRNQSYTVKLLHVGFLNHVNIVEFPKFQWRCSQCGKTITPEVSFKAEGAMITKGLEDMIIRYLSMDEFTLTDVSIITGVNINTIKRIDLRRLQKQYTDGHGKLKKPEHFSAQIGIDEFKLHNGHKYATHVIDLNTGEVLYIAAGKKKQVVYDFIDFVGDDWMKHVEAAAMDMNSDFQEAFKERCPWIQIVYDHFHLVKNFNDKVVAEIRKDEQRRLISEGNMEEARKLKKARMILTSSRKTLQQRDREAREGKICRKGSELFHTTDYRHSHDDYEERYDAIIKSNRLLFTCDLIKEAMQEAYASQSSATMIEKFTDIIDWCRASGDGHMAWFARLIENHFDGIVAYGDFQISSGRIEGINNHIKTLRRKAYGLPDDEYFFLKVIDCSHHPFKRV
jgi:transposase